MLDGTIVSLSIFEMLMTALASGTGVKLSFLRMLRMLRVLRILRLMKKWKGLYNIILALARSLPQMANMVVLMGLICLIFALLGMQLFGGQFTPDGFSLPSTRLHFDYFAPAMITVFIVFCGGWCAARARPTHRSGSSQWLIAVAQCSSSRARP